MSASRRLPSRNTRSWSRPSTVSCKRPRSSLVKDLANTVRRHSYIRVEQIEKDISAAEAHIEEARDGIRKLHKELDRMRADEKEKEVSYSWHKRSHWGLPILFHSLDRRSEGRAEACGGACNPQPVRRRAQVFGARHQGEEASDRRCRATDRAAGPRDHDAEEGKGRCRKPRCKSRETTRVDRGGARVSIVR